jgi:DNA-binding NarL/FixJ family response regulator
MGDAYERQEPIRALLVDDQTLLRHSFQRLLDLEGAGVEVVGAAADGLEALELIERLTRDGRPPQVVLMDVRMPRMDGVQATARIRERWPDVRVMMLTTFDDEEYIVEGLRAGARGYLLKDASADELVAAIHAVHRGDAPLQPSVAAKLVARLNREPEPPAQPASPELADAPHASLSPALPGEELTEREREILRSLAHGASNREIGEALFITEGTVKNHVSSILSKLALRDRTQAALWARAHGLD